MCLRSSGEYEILQNLQKCSMANFIKDFISEFLLILICFANMNRFHHGQISKNVNLSKFIVFLTYGNMLFRFNKLCLLKYIDIAFQNRLFATFTPPIKTQILSKCLAECPMSNFGVFYG